MLHMAKDVAWKQLQVGSLRASTCQKFTVWYFKKSLLFAIAGKLPSCFRTGNNAFLHLQHVMAE